MINRIVVKFWFSIVLLFTFAGCMNSVLNISWNNLKSFKNSDSESTSNLNLLPIEIFPPEGCYCNAFTANVYSLLDDDSIRCTQNNNENENSTYEDFLPIRLKSEYSISQNSSLKCAVFLFLFPFYIYILFDRNFLLYQKKRSLACYTLLRKYLVILHLMKV